MTSPATAPMTVPTTVPTTVPIPFAVPASVAEARAVQDALRERVVVADRLGIVQAVAGVDVGISRRRNRARAAVVLLDMDTLAVRAAAIAEQPPGFPYVPGFLSFREIPVILEALAALGEAPDLLIVDGHGLAHPRRIGLASHLGLATGLPAIGVAKSRLLGTYAEPASDRGATSVLMDGVERLGTVLRSRENVRPLFVSPGHLVGHDSAVALTLKCLTRYRLPEPTRLADKLSKFPRC